MENFERFLEIGKSLNLEGPALLDFVNEKCGAIEERTRRVEEREEKRLEMERVKEEKRLEMERVKEESHKRQEIEQERANKEFELRRLELALETERLKASTQVPPTGNTTRIDSRPKLPYFNEKIDNIESYLYKFELHATSAGWKRESWAGILVTLLQGRALDYFREMPMHQVNEFDKVKQLLLRRFIYTEEAFREKFRTIRLEKGEDVSAFGVRLTTAYNRWTELANANDAMEKINDLMIRDQMYNGFHRDLVAFLKERKPGSVQEVTTLAEQYREAHPNRPMIRSAVSHETFGATAVQENRERSQSMGRARSRHNFQSNEHRHSGDNQFKRDKSQQPYRQDRSQYGYPQQRQFKQHTQSQTQTKTFVCFRCQKPGHIAKYCKEETVASVAYHVPNKSAEVSCCQECHKVNEVGSELELKCGHKLPVLAIKHMDGNLKFEQGFVNRERVSVLRDSGCTTVGVHKRLVPAEDYTGRSVSCILFTGGAVKLPIATIFIDTPYFTGEVEACVLDQPICDLIIGNIPTVTECSESIQRWYAKKGIEVGAAVETRSSAGKQDKPLKNLSLPVDITRDQLIQLQKADPNLQRCFREASIVGNIRQHKNATSRFYFNNDLLYREYKGRTTFDQLVTPTCLLSTILKVAHDTPMSGHMGISRTRERVMYNFYWPQVFKDVADYCKSCDKCQRTTHRDPKAPIQRIPAIANPFEKVSIDIVGPIYPATDRGHRYFLTLIDAATRWPEAVPLRNITAEIVAEALFGIFSRLGIPNEILTDQGSQFMSGVMKELFRLLSIKQTRTSPYHAQSNGMVERLNGTIKQLLKRVTSDQPREWDRFLPAVLFSYREVTQESTGFSPFELLYGRKPRGPTDILHDIITENKDNSEDISAFEYISNLKDRLSSTCELAKQASEKASFQSRQYKNRGSKLKIFEVGDNVLLLLPTDNNKLLMTWKGPYKVLKRTSNVDYVIMIDGKEKLFHCNMLKKYNLRPGHLSSNDNITTASNSFAFASVAVITSADCDIDDREHTSQILDTVNIKIPPLQGNETFENVNIGQNLNDEQENEVRDTLSFFQDVLSDIPGRTKIIEHDIVLTSDTPIRLKPYPIPLKSKDLVEAEIKSLLEMGIIEASLSPYSSPIVLVKKKDGAIRFAIDFRKLNAVTKFDATPIPNQEDLLATISSSHYFSKLDLTKGYWQIPMTESSRQYTAFQTPLGLFQWKYMPFGLSNAPATFARMMRLVLRNIPNVVSFFDDILIHTPDWKTHLMTLGKVFKALRESGLTAKPSKVYIGFHEINFLGHVISQGVIQPEDEKISKIMSLTIPKTKKEVRSIIGILSYYRRFISDFASLSSILSDLTKKGKPDKIRWTADCDRAFRELQIQLSSKPILMLPDIYRTFILRTDASGTGIGACLMQKEDDILHPVMYASRKLLPREIRYPVIERECLAIVWAIDKFSRYLYGSKFIVQTDHKPLKFLQQNRSNSARLCRWALSLQSFAFDIEAIPGSHNNTADVLSRLC